MYLNKVTILGAGNMGTGLAHLIAGNGYPVTLWTIEADVARDINRKHLNQKYLPGIKLPLAVRAGTDLKSALKDSEVVVIAVPTQAVTAVMKQAAAYLPPKAIILSTAKGLELKTGKTVSQIIKSVAPEFHKNLAVLMGPLFAIEIAKERPSVGLLATKDKKVFDFLKKILDNNYFFTRWSNDVVGAELAGALKNVYAILMGVCDGLGYGWNTKSATITGAVRELAAAGELLGAKKETMYGLAGLGDLLTTGFGETSRNRRFGEMICVEKSVDAALKKIGQVVEGAKTVEIAIKLFRKYKKQTPLLHATYDMIHKKTNPCAVFQEILKNDI
ncbi:MAG: NAD(P)H-dependent glycerol-3-phosphate dehydrogenase [Patescibacteria group bacterium]